MGLLGLQPLAIVWGQIIPNTAVFGCEAQYGGSLQDVPDRAAIPKVRRISFANRSFSWVRCAGHQIKSRIHHSSNTRSETYTTRTDPDRSRTPTARGILCDNEILASITRATQTQILGLSEHHTNSAAASNGGDWDPTI